VTILKPLNTAYYNIFHFTIGADYSQVGDRIATLFIDNGERLLLSIDANNFQNDAGNLQSVGSLVPGTKFHLRIEQAQGSDSSYYINTYINHQKKHQTLNSVVTSFSNVKVYASNPWYQESEDVFVLQGFKYGGLN